jgi:hypothetical protein
MKYKLTTVLVVLAMSQVFSLLSSLSSKAQFSPALLEDITVRIDTSSNHPADIGGSGVLATRVGNTYTILTAYHVIQNTNQDYIIKIPNKTSSELFDSYVIPVKTHQQQIKRIGSMDLASISIRSTKVYKTATIDNQRSLSQYDNIFIAGYPQSNRREYLAMRAQYDYECSYRSEIYGSLKKAYCLNILNTSSGMSGGPVVDKYGYIVGILVGKNTDEKNSEAIASVAIPILNYPDWRAIDKPGISNQSSSAIPLTKDPPYVIEESNIITTTRFDDRTKYGLIDYSLLLRENPVKRLRNKPFAFWAVLASKPEDYESRALCNKLRLVYQQAKNIIFKNIVSVEPDQMPYLKSLFEHKFYINLAEVLEGYSYENNLYKHGLYASIDRTYLNRLSDFNTSDILKIEAVLREEQWGFIRFGHIEIHRVSKVGSIDDGKLLRRCKWLNILPQAMQNRFFGCKSAEEMCKMWKKSVSEVDFYFKSHCQ